MSEYVVGNQLGADGSHHVAYELIGNSEWIFLVNDGTESGIIKTVTNRKKAYSKFPGSIIASMGSILELNVKNKLTYGVLLERMDGEYYHSTRQGWKMGMRKTVLKWKSQDSQDIYKSKLEKLKAGIDTFIQAGQVVDDFQYWVREDGRFMLSDVKSAEIGETKVIHAPLVDCLNEVTKILRALQ